MVPAALVDGGVFLLPVVRQAQARPQVAEGLLVFLGDYFAQLDEVRAADRRRIAFAAAFGLEIRVVVDVRLALDVVQVLHAALGGQAVVVPADGEEDVLAAHALVAHDEILVRVAEHVAQMQRAADRRRRRVDDKRLVAAPVGVVRVDSYCWPSTAIQRRQSLPGYTSAAIPLRTPDLMKKRANMRA